MPRLHLIGLLFLCTPAVAAERVLVLPLGGESSGLGEALSVWLTEDLARAPSLDAPTRLEVEAAMPTGTSAPLSLNLHYAISGAWAQTNGEFTLIASVGATEARATGPASDFVLIEQQVAAQLLTALGAEAAPSSPPTEQLDALAEWGTGLQHRRAGDTEAARASFGKALALDPGFARARDDLAAMGAPTTPRVTHSMTSAQDTILGRHDPLTGAPDQAGLIGFALRLMALENEGMHCERADEMTAFLEAVDYKVSLPSGLTEAAMATAVATEARALRFSAVPRTVSDLPPASYSMPQRRVAGQFATTADFIFREASARNVAGSGLFGAIVQCDAPAEQQARVAALAQEVFKRNLADQLQAGRPAPGWTVRESFELAWAWIQAEQFGASPELDKRLDLLTTARDPSDPIQQQLLDRARELKTRAAKTIVPQTATGTDDQIVAQILGAAGGAENVVHTKPMGCAHALESMRGAFYDWSSQIGTSSMEDATVRATHMKQGAAYVAALSELGCFVGTTALHSDPEAVRQSVRQRLDQLPPGALSAGDCASQVAALRGDLGSLTPTDASAVTWLLQIHDVRAAGCGIP